MADSKYYLNCPEDPQLNKLYEKGSQVPLNYTCGSWTTDDVFDTSKYNEEALQTAMNHRHGCYRTEYWDNTTEGGSEGKNYFITSDSVKHTDQELLFYAASVDKIPSHTIDGYYDDSDNIIKYKTNEIDEYKKARITLSRHSDANTAAVVDFKQSINTNSYYKTTIENKISLLSGFNPTGFKCINSVEYAKFVIERLDEKLKITKDYLGNKGREVITEIPASKFPNHIVPMRFVVIMTAQGGSGGNGYKSQDFGTIYDGNGGGSGATISAVIELPNKNSKITLINTRYKDLLFCIDSDSTTGLVAGRGIDGQTFSAGTGGTGKVIVNNVEETKNKENWPKWLLACDISQGADGGKEDRGNPVTDGERWTACTSSFIKFYKYGFAGGTVKSGGTWHTGYAGGGAGSIWGRGGGAGYFDSPNGEDAWGPGAGGGGARYKYGNEKGGRGGGPLFILIA